jgi:hypothetical protein
MGKCEIFGTDVLPKSAGTVEPVGDTEGRVEPPDWLSPEVAASVISGPRSPPTISTRV